MAKINWKAVKKDYITDLETKHTAESLAEKYGISKSSIEKRCASENWVQQREDHEKEILKKLKEKAAEKHAEKLFKTVEFCETIEIFCKKHFFDSDNQLVSSITTKKLKEIMETVSLNVKTRKLLLGEPDAIVNQTGKIDHEHTGEISQINIYIPDNQRDDKNE